MNSGFKIFFGAKNDKSFWLNGECRDVERGTVGVQQEVTKTGGARLADAHNCPLR